MDGLQLLGAADALANQFITLRVKNIDREKFRQTLGGTSAAALHFVDAAPKAALDVAMPFVVRKAKEYGVDLETAVTDAPLQKGKRSASEFWPGLGIGVVIGAMGLAIVKLVAHVVVPK